MKRYFTLILFFLCINFVAAEPASLSGEELLKSCQAALNDGFDGLEGMVCHWYVTPCDCEKDVEQPRVCLPHRVSDVALAKRVVRELESDRSMLVLKAELAANTILARYYPCDE